MQVVATAGHVDHGKSALIRALTGRDPDRWAEEKRRGMTLDLGFAWATLPGDVDVTFVDVPGHERFVPTMLAGVGPVPAVLLVVDAGDGWMPQTAEHAAVLHALEVERVVVAITRCDRVPRASAKAVEADVAERLQGTSLGRHRTVICSATTGEGLDAVRLALADMVAQLPVPDPDAPTRMWVDRSFTIRGAGTVVTGTLPAGRLSVGDILQLAPGGREVHVRALQSREQPVDAATGVARVAVNLRGVDRDEVRRGDALLGPGPFVTATDVDVVGTTDPQDWPRGMVVHVGSAATAVRVRPLGEREARLRLATPLPLVAGDVLVLRDPAMHRIVDGVRVVDMDPPALRHRGDPQLRAQAIRAFPLTEAGRQARRRSHAEQEAARPAADPPPPRSQPATLSPAAEALAARLSENPLAAPDRDEVVAIGGEQLGLLMRAGRVVNLGSHMFVGPDAEDVAVRLLCGLADGWTVSQACAALGVSRRIGIPLLGHLDAARRTVRDEQNLRRLTGR